MELKNTNEFQNINMNPKIISYAIKNLYNRLFNRWSKWELYDSDHPYTVTTMSNPLCGPVYPTHVAMGVKFDIYEKTNRFTGLKKYKKVRKN